MRIGVLLVAAVSSGLMSACGDSGKIASLQVKNEELEKKLQELEFQVKLQQTVNGLDQVVYLTPGSDGYGVVRMDLGHLTVNLSNISPYANGSKVSLTFGNLTSATIDGLKAKIEWGPVDEKAMPVEEKTRSREVTLNESLTSGAWTQTNVILEAVPPEHLGFVRVRDITHRGIRLLGRFGGR